MVKQLSIESLLKHGSKQWNDARRANRVQIDSTGATFPQLFSANADLSGLILVGTEWEKCDLSRVSFREADLSNAYFHGGRLQDCDFRGAKLDGATFERLKLVRCDFTNAEGLDGVEFDDCDLDRVTGIDGVDAPPAPPPPVVGITSFTREQRTAAIVAQQNAESELPPFRPGDEPVRYLMRWLKHAANPPAWVLDVPSLRLPPPLRLGSGASFEFLYRDAVKSRLEGRRAIPDASMVKRAMEVIADGGPDCALAVVYLTELGEAIPLPADAALATITEQVERSLANEDGTGDLDPRLAQGLLVLGGAEVAGEYFGEVRMRLAAGKLCAALLEAGFTPDNNWEEAVSSTEASLDLAHVATNGQRENLEPIFRAYASLPDDARMRRLAYNAEALAHLEALLASGR